MFRFHTKPRKYQLTTFNYSKDLEYYALFWEMRLGKSKVIIDTLDYLYSEKKVNAGIIISKSNVCRNWINEEFPKHMLPEIQQETCIYLFENRYAKTKKQKNRIDELVIYKGLSILVIPFDTFVTEAGKLAVWKFLKNRKVLYIIDESARIKTPGTDRTKAIVKSGKYAAYRRIMSGTPYTNKGPFDIYAPFRFLYERFWLNHGLRNFGMFKTYFGEWGTGYRRTDKGIREYPKFECFKNLKDLRQWIKPHHSRLLRDDVYDIPPKDYGKLYFDLNPEQLRLYNKLKEELYIELENGALLTAPLAISRLLRFQQITCGYLPNPDDPDGQELCLLGKDNPRLKCLIEYTEDCSYQGIIWARFTSDVDFIVEKLGESSRRYDGKIKEHDRPVILQDFKKDKFQWLVAKATCLGEGVTLDNADLSIYYSNTFSYMDRLQSEDRTVSVTKKHSEVVLDIVASDVQIDKHLIATLREKQNVASSINGDKIKQWI